MTTLSPESDQSVRQAVDAYLDGTFRPDLGHEARFETRNGHYRLVGGVLLHVVRGTVNDVSHIGSELVGWLWEGHSGSRVEVSWRHSARGVLVDRRRGRHIVITSATRNFVSEMLARSPLPQAGSTDHHQGGSSNVRPVAGTIPLAAYVPGAADGVRQDTRWSGPPMPRESAPPARWGAATPFTPLEPIRAANPSFPAPSLFDSPETHRSPAPPAPIASVASGGLQTVPSTSSPPRPLPLPVAPPRRFDTPATEVAPAAMNPTHLSPTQPSPPLQTREAGHASELPTVHDRSLPRAYVQAPPGAEPGRDRAEVGFRPVDDDNEKDEDVPATIPIATKPLPPRRPTSAHVQRGMLLR